MSRTSIGNSLSHSTEKLRRGTLLCSRKILLSKNDRDKRGERLSKFLVEFFLSHSAKFFVREPFSVSLIAGIKKVCIKGGREYRDFPSKFLSHCTEIFHWRTLWSFRKRFFIEIFHA